LAFGGVLHSQTMESGRRESRSESWGRPAPPPPRTPARRVCFWYQALDVAKASASCRYRINNLCELLSGADIVIKRELPRQIRARVATVCMIRPLVTPALLAELAALREGGVRLVADFDDLLFAGPVSGLPGSVGGATSTALLDARLAGYAAALTAFDAFTVATRPLREQILQRVPAAKVKVVPNGLSEAWVRQGRALYDAFQPGDPLIIRYFAGSPSHDEDFASVVEPIRRFLIDHPEVRLELVGSIRADISTFPEGRVAFLPAVPYETLPMLIAKSWVNIAPLFSSQYAEGKSALKVLEAAAFGCPTLASPNDDVRRHHAQGAPVRLCETAEDWQRELERALEPSQRMELGHAARLYADAHAMARSSLTAWEALVLEGARA
jgi:glycosyltransferase involved in cell wall biosynthesis